ncbi:hypothetical protein Aperf_G00000099783 [Anoplocephala perfoliata]
MRPVAKDVGETAKSSVDGSQNSIGRSENEDKMQKLLARMRSAVPETEQDKINFDEKAFLSLYQSFINLNNRDPVDWNKIQQLDENHIKSYRCIGEVKEKDIGPVLSRLVVLKLNGGLGTSMNCSGPKSLIPVRNGRTFLEISLSQIEELNGTYDSNIPFVLMNSFNTHQETEEFLEKMKKIRTKVYSFQQNRFPRLSEESELPITDTLQLKELHDPAWYPPGHGDVYRCFYESGLLDEFANEGKTWIFLSNIDNLGAVPDPAILYWLENQEKEVDFLMEVADKTPADRKGGTLVLYNGSLKLLEIAQVPNEHVNDFLDPKRFEIFNTNNLWINIGALRYLLGENKIIMDLIVNRKTLADGTRVIQLEEASGAAISCFKKAMGLKVSRNRFLPVKMTSDLLLLRSDLFNEINSVLTVSLQRKIAELPIIEVDHNFKSEEDLQKRIPNIPNMIDLRHLTLSGDIRFGSNVVLKGTVRIEAKGNEQIIIPDGTVLEDEVITGTI